MTINIHTYENRKALVLRIRYGQEENSRTRDQKKGQEKNSSHTNCVVRIVGFSIFRGLNLISTFFVVVIVNPAQSKIDSFVEFAAVPIFSASSFGKETNCTARVP